MPRRAPGAPPKPRGRPRKPHDLLSPRAKRWRNALDANNCTALMIIETPTGQHQLVIEQACQPLQDLVVQGIVVEEQRLDGKH